MAKAKKKAENTGIVPPEQLAIIRAANIKALREEIEKKQVELKSLEMEQIDFMETEQLPEFEGLMIVERPGAVKWEGQKGKALDYAKERLLNVLDKTFVKESIDSEKLFVALESDFQLQSMFKNLGVSLIRSESSKSLRLQK